MTTGTQSFLSVNTTNHYKKFDDQVKKRLLLQLITDIWRVLQKLLRYFNGTTIWTYFLSTFSVCSVIFCLSLSKHWLSQVKWQMTPALKQDNLYTIVINFHMFSNKYYYIPLNDTSMFLAWSVSELFISLVKSVHGAQFLLLRDAPANAVLGIAIFLLKSAYTSV